MALNSRRRDQPNASQQLKRVGGVVIGLSGLALLWVVMGLVVDPPGDNIIAVPFSCMALWGLATGIGLLRLRPWARISMLVFHSLLCICGVLSVVLLVVHASAMPRGIVSVRNLGVVTMATTWFTLISVTIGVQGLRFFRRNDIRAHFGGIP